MEPAVNERERKDGMAGKSAPRAKHAGRKTGGKYTTWARREDVRDVAVPLLILLAFMLGSWIAP